MKKLLIIILFFSFASVVNLFAYEEENLYGKWEVQSFMSDMIRSFYTFDKDNAGELEIVIQASEERSFHSFTYEIRENILFITLVDEETGEALVDRQSGKTMKDQYRIVVIKENEMLLKTADRDVVFIKQ